MGQEVRGSPQTRTGSGRAGLGGGDDGVTTDTAAALSWACHSLTFSATFPNSPFFTGV